MTNKQTRRALLGGAVAGGAAVALRAVGGPDPVRAGQQTPIYRNQVNSLLRYTSTQDADGGEIYMAETPVTLGIICHVANGLGLDVLADGAAGTGVYASTAGLSSQIAIEANAASVNGEGIAVKARTKNGTALYGEATGGHALHIQGVSWFSRSGKALIAQGKSSKTITLVGQGNYITNDSFVVATVQGTATGVWVRSCSTNVAANTVTIRLNNAAPADLRVGWIVID